MALASWNREDPLIVARLAATLRARIEAWARERRADSGEDAGRDEAVIALLAGLAVAVGRMFEVWRGHVARMRTSKERGRLAFGPRSTPEPVAPYCLLLDSPPVGS